MSNFDPMLKSQQFSPTMDYYIPQWEERTSYGMRRIDPYTKLFEDRIIFLGTPISDEIANAVMAQLLCLQQMDAERQIDIYINSPGGSFTALTAIYDTMRYIKPDVSTVCLGQAASAAAVILAAGTKGKRLALPNSRILIHQPATEGGYGQSSDIEIQAREILRIRIADGGHARERYRPQHRGSQQGHRAGQVPDRRAGARVRHHRRGFESAEGTGRREAPPRLADGVGMSSTSSAARVRVVGQPD